MRPDVDFVLGCYEAQLGPPSGRSCRYLAAAGGLSGACFWRVVCDQGTFCLRRWPREHPDRNRLQWIHSTLAWVVAQGFRRIPLPLPNNRGATFVEHQSHFWEVSPWLDGEADFDRQPNDEKLRQASQTLAQFHQVTRSFVGNHRGPAKSLTYRLKVLDGLQRGEFAAISKRLQRVPPQWRREASQLVARFPRAAPRLAAELRVYAISQYALQPCLRDVRREHVFFVGDQVQGLVDFGSLDFDDAATDVARLFGSLAGDDQRFWRVARDAYGEIVVTDEAFWRRVSAIDRANVVLAGMNWLRWICLEGRQFDDQQLIACRVRETLQRLVHLTDNDDRADDNSIGPVSR